MKAIVIEQYGGPEVLQWNEAPRPEPGPGDVLVKVAAAGINRADLAARAKAYKGEPHRRGVYFYPFPSLPAIPGIEAAGTVEAVGADVTRVKPGDRVCGITSTGSYAEYATMLDWVALPIPDGVSFAEAAAIPATFQTAWLALNELSAVRWGETVLIHAIGSGVGTAATQIARRAGARVLGTSRSDAKLEKAKTVGMNAGFNLTSGDFRDWVREQTGGEGVDVVIDNVGGDVLAQTLDVMAINGRMVCLSSTAGGTAEIEIGRIIGGHLKIMGMSMAAMLTPDRMDRFRADVLSGFPDPLRPIVDTAFAITDAPQAHQYVAENRNFGKVVLVTPYGQEVEQ